MPHLIATFLGAHALPPEFTREEAYVDYLIDQVIPTAAAHGAVYADAFCEPGFFSPAQTRRYLEACAEAGMRLRVHCDEMAFGGAAEMAVEVGVDAVDHCNCIRDEDVRAIADAGIVTVACPATIAYLELAQKAPGARAARTRRRRCARERLQSRYVAVLQSADGRLFRADALRLVGRRGAVRRHARGGALVAQRCRRAARSASRADFVALQIDSPDEFGWQFGGNLARAVVHRGELVE